MKYWVWKLSLRMREIAGLLWRGVLVALVCPFRITRFLWRKRVIPVALFAVIAYFSIDIGMCFFRPEVFWLNDHNPRLTEMMVHQERHPAKSGKRLRIKHQWIPLSRISPYLVEAVLIAEDDKFWSHKGFDFEALRKAVERDIKERKFKVGGSTITQQLAKNLFLRPTKNPSRKLKEAILAWRIERAVPKKRILEIYLNVAEWGDSIYGIEAAARHYYGKGASALGPMESSRLAASLPNPKRYSPTGKSRYILNRSRVILELMKKRGITR